MMALVSPDTWTTLFSSSPDVHVVAAGYLLIAGPAYVLIALNTLAAAFQAMGQPRWPLLAVVVRTVIMIAGGWIVIHVTGGGLIGLAVVTAAGLIVPGAIIAIAYRANTRLEVKDTARASA